jgi:hypothetical protein
MAAISSSSRLPQAPAPMSLTASGGGGFWRAKRRGHVGIVQLLAKARARLQLDELGKSLGYPFTKKILILTARPPRTPPPCSPSLSFSLTPRRFFAIPPPFPSELSISLVERAVRSTLGTLDAR